MKHTPDAGSPDEDQSQPAKRKRGRRAAAQSTASAEEGAAETEAHGLALTERANLADADTDAAEADQDEDVDADGDPEDASGDDEDEYDDDEADEEDSDEIDDPDEEDDSDSSDDGAESAEADDSEEEAAVEEEAQDAEPGDAAAGDGQAAEVDGAGGEASAGEGGAESESGADGDTGNALPLERVVEAILFAAQEPLQLKQIARCAGKRVKREAVCEIIDQLNRSYEEQGHAFEIVKVAETYQVMTRPEYVEPVRRLLGDKAVQQQQSQDRKLSPAAMDSLSIIAYKQPITRVEIETVRGVGCGPVLRQLTERGLVRIVGKREDVIGHPLMYGTTEQFLREFGLGSLDELPMVHELRKITGTTRPLPSPVLAPAPEDDAPVQLSVLTGEPETASE